MAPEVHCKFTKELPEVTGGLPGLPGLPELPEVTGGLPGLPGLPELPEPNRYIVRPDREYLNFISSNKFHTLKSRYD